MKITKTIAMLAALSTFAGGSSALAQFVPDTSNSGFTTGYYSADEDEAAKAETQKLYDNRPVNVRRAEYLTRGLCAVPSDNGVLVSWRFLGTDSKNTTYDLYKGNEKLNTSPIAGTNLLDKGGKPGDEYRLVSSTGEETTAKAWDKGYKEFSVKKYDTGDYIIDDGAVGDLDGDGEFEIIIRRTPKDMKVDTRVAYPLIEAYEQDGTYLWTINIGPNEINEHDLNMMVYDFNGDGKSELIMRSFEGTTDGKGDTITGKNGKVTDYSKDPNNLDIMTDRQYLISTPEYLSMYDGVTGAELARTELLPKQEPLMSWSYRYTDTGRLVKRASHHNFCLAYLDGVTPSFVEVRGAWDNVKAAAWHIEDNKFVQDWELDTPNVEDVNSIYGACNHNTAVADIDFDGFDEILSGPMAIDHDGKQMYAVKAAGADGVEVKLAHGDAFDVAKMDPDFDGYYVWACHETKNLPANIELHDARTGQVIFGYGKTKDCGRSRAADIDPNYIGYEVWGATATVPMNISGEKIADGFNTFFTRLPDGSFQTDETGTCALQGTLPMNFMIHWDGDLLAEFLDGTRISEYNYDAKCIDVIMDAEGCMSNNGTKAVPVAAADILGDWRDEVIWKTADESGIRIYSTPIETEYKIPAPMHDIYYRASIAMQNNHYNQPANYSYYFGAETKTVPNPPVYMIKDGVRIENADADKEYEINVGTAKTAAAELKLLVNSPYAYSDDRIVMIDETDSKVVPTVINDNTLVPVRFISESFGCEVGWNEAEQKVTVKGGDTDISMVIGDTAYTVNGESKSLETAPRIINDRTMLPLRAVAESLGKKVAWDGASELIVIGMNAAEPVKNAAEYAAVLKEGKAPEKAPVELPTPTPTPEPQENPYASMNGETKSVDGTDYTIYIDEDFSSYSNGDAAGWAGTKPAPIKNIGVENGAITFSGSDKGNRNAVYTLPGGMTGKVYMDLDWTVGEMTGGTSVGELRFADSDGAVFLSFRTSAGKELEYNYGGKISNKGLETLEWKPVGSGFTDAGTAHIRAVADFDKQSVTFTVTQNSKKADITMPFTDAKDFGAIEVLAVRNEKNWNWTTALDNLTFGMAK